MNASGCRTDTVQIPTPFRGFRLGANARHCRRAPIRLSTFETQRRIIGDARTPSYSAAAAPAARRRRPELCQRIAARTADCEHGSAAEGFQPCPAHPPPVAARGRAPDNDAHDSASQRARHSYTAAHLARTPRAPPRQGSDAFGLGLGSGPCSGSALTGHRGSMDRTSRARVWAGRTRRGWLETAQRVQRAQQA